MISFQHTIQDELGLHARPAGLLVKLASGYNADIALKCGEKTASAKKLFQVMSLGAKGGSELTVTISGEDEDAAAASIKNYLTEHV